MIDAADSARHRLRRFVGSIVAAEADGRIPAAAEGLARRLDLRVESARPIATTDELIAASQQASTRLLVLARSSPGSPGEDDLARAVDRLACPTLILAPEHTTWEAPRFVSAIGGEETGHRVLGYSASLAAALGGTVTATTVVSDGDLAAATRMLHRCAQKSAQGADVAIQARSGRVLAGLRQTVRDHHADVIAVGRPRFSGAEHLLGSVPQALVLAGDASVLVIPPVVG